MSDTPIVDTNSGLVRGRAHRGDTTLFGGIPYAAAPVNDLRFAPPHPVEPWVEPLDCQKPAPRAPQNPGITEMLAGQTKIEWTEDCLSLNVTTGAPSESPKPVMVWIHGGGFTGGTSSIPWYDGASLASDGVVVVSINYRLGALGFLHHDTDHGVSGNNGILDQIAALEWVRNNISAFGGDPSNVTVFGESAGAMSVGTLLAAPAAKGLFRRAILQSGAGHHVHSDDDARQVTDAFLDLLVERGAHDASHATVEQILDAQNHIGDKLKDILGDDSIGMAFQPVIDGTNLLERPLDAIADGSADGIDVVAGWNLDEWDLFSIAERGDITQDSFDRRMTATFGDDSSAATVEYRDQLAGRSINVSNRAIWNAAMTDFVFRIPAIRLLEAHTSRPGRTFGYEFGFESTAFAGRLGSCHALEIPFVFGTLDRPGVSVFLGGTSDDAEELSQIMRRGWSSFATDGDPDIEGWIDYDSNSRVTYGFDTSNSPRTDPNAATRKLWVDRR
ncbi:MAG: carboxylesterase family protein [Actinomycetia bacterium]|nr:carboxylesterase family protein [Actinomycetes bacterium]